jgi:replicative DNA helicase
VDNISVKGEETSLIFSLEMDSQSIVDRLICARARVNTKKFECGYLNAEESRRAAKAAGEIDCDHILIDDKATTDMGEIHAKIRKEQARRKVGLVVIDYLQLMIGGDVKHRVAEASKVSRDMKLVAKDCAVPVLSLSQLSRECDSRPDHRPMLSDLRDTGAIEQDADLVMFLYRGEVYYPDREDLRGMADLIVAKQRNGPIDTIPLVWLKEIVRFENAAEDRNEEMNYHDR